MAHGFKTNVFPSHNDICHHGAPLFEEVVSRTVHDVMPLEVCKLQHIEPPRLSQLVIQADNTSSQTERKNSESLLWQASLVSKGVVDTCQQLHIMMVSGHTHEDIDAFFAMDQVLNCVIRRQR